MAMQDMFQELKDFDINDLDADNIGSWPMPVKVIVWLVVFAAVLTLGYVYDIADMRDKLASAEREEQTLKEQYTRQAYLASNLEAYRRQMVEMDVSFDALVSQLPSDTEVPGLLEDITNKGLESGLDITQIGLGSEQAKEFYIELPIEIEVEGGYHDLGTFVSGIAGLPRIVTLHEFEINERKDSSRLVMKITAKTYRYKEMEE